MKVTNGGATAPKGFLAAGVAAGIAKKAGKKDVALIYSKVPATAAGVFTTNKVKAAPVIVSQQAVAGGILQAVAINSGNANACTGASGMENARKMAAAAASALGIDFGLVAVASTGVIGVPLPIEKVEAGLVRAASELSADGGAQAAEAIMTTDTVPKEIAVEVPIGGSNVIIGGMAKGSGMIHPNMATMLGFINTDAAIGPEALHKALALSVERTFNMITVDGDTSTNDMVLVLANGLAGASFIEEGTPEWAAFQQGLEFVCRHLAKSIARDGEGATKLIEVQVTGALTFEDARKAALAVAKSSLVKTAIFGQDANWGRIICALGYSGAAIDPDRVDIYLGPVKVCEAGVGLPFSEEEAAAVLARPEVTIQAELNSGDAGATAWGCDLSYDYVKINGSYRT